MGVIAELAAGQRERASAAETVAPEPAPGQVYRDGVSPGFRWRVQWVDDGFVFLRGITPAGKATRSYLNWPRNRWPTLVERQRLTLLEE